jgi:hypothetical protein
MKIVRLPDHPTFFEVLEKEDLYALLRNRDTQEEFVVGWRAFQTFIPVTHPCIRKEV